MESGRFPNKLLLVCVGLYFCSVQDCSIHVDTAVFEDLLAERGKDSSEIRLQACDKSRNGREARSVIFHEINDAQIHLASDLPIA